MITRASESGLDAPIIVIDIGNTSTGIATSTAGQLKTPMSVATGDPAAFEKAFGKDASALPKGKPAAVVVSSVVPDMLAHVRTYVDETLDRRVLVIGDTIPFPIDVSVMDRKAVGVDRVCAASAAFEQFGTGCTVVDFGSAVTVDVVDDDGTFQGGAILPGLAMQLRALHEYTVRLPEVTRGFPELPYGRNTTEAMQTGVCRGLVGAVRALVEAYATALNRWPKVVATGGDAAFLAPHCDFLDSVVEHLTLQGVALAYVKHLTDSGV